MDGMGLDHRLKGRQAKDFVLNVEQLAAERWPQIETVIDTWEKIICETLIEAGQAQWGSRGFVKPKKVNRKRLRFDYERLAIDLCIVELTWKVKQKPVRLFSRYVPGLEIKILVVFPDHGFCTKCELFFKGTLLNKEGKQFMGYDDLAKGVLTSYIEGLKFPSVKNYKKTRRQAM